MPNGGNSRDRRRQRRRAERTFRAVKSAALAATEALRQIAQAFSLSLDEFAAGLQRFANPRLSSVTIPLETAFDLDHMRMTPVEDEEPFTLEGLFREIDDVLEDVDESR